MAEITGDEALELLQGGEDDVAEWNRRREAALVHEYAMAPRSVPKVSRTKTCTITGA